MHFCIRAQREGQKQAQPIHEASEFFISQAWVLTSIFYMGICPPPPPTTTTVNIPETKGQGAGCSKLGKKRRNALFSLVVVMDFALFTLFRPK